MKLQHISKSFAGQAFPAVKDCSLQLEQGHILGLVGESGSGKTTLLRLIAGFEVPEHGTIDLHGRCVSGPSQFVAPEKRGIGMVFQHYALFPHLTVHANIAFGLRHLRRKQQQQKLNRVLTLTGLEGLGGRYPHELSGGQQQRVALARALAPEPALLLFDEPFSHLDEPLKIQMREAIAHILKDTGTTAIIVTHDTRDVMAIADRVAVLHKGRILQNSTPAEVYTYPVNTYVANFFGRTNLLTGKLEGKRVKTILGACSAPSEMRAASGQVTLSLRPERVRLLLDEKGIPASVRQVRFYGRCTEVEVELKDNGPCLVACVSRHVKTQPGASVQIAVDPQDIHVLPEG